MSSFTADPINSFSAPLLKFILNFKILAVRHIDEAPFPNPDSSPEVTAVVSLLGILPDHFLCIYLYVYIINKPFGECVFIFADKCSYFPAICFSN